MLNKIISTIFLLLYVSVLNAANEQITPDKTIVSVHTYNNFVFVNFHPNEANTQGCSNADSNRRAAIDLTNGNGKELYSAVMAAAMASKKVGFGINGCSNGRPLIYRIDTIF